MAKTINFESVECLGYQDMQKIDYLEILNSSDIEEIITELINQYPNVLYLGREITEEHIEALKSIFYGEYLFEKELVIFVSHYKNYCTLGFSNTIDSFENVFSGTSYTNGIIFRFGILQINF